MENAYFSASDFSANGLANYQKIRDKYLGADAVGYDMRVVYPHRMVIPLEIPSAAETIPLTRYTDFK